MSDRWRVERADVLEWCAEYDGPKFHAMLTDSPYHLTSITERFGKEGAAPAQYGRDGAFQRISKGFMGSTWDGETDGVGIAFRAKTWAALSEHLLPGAFIFVFGSSRGWHRLAVAIEDAGFVFHPSLMVWGWVSGSGFPKATNLSKVLDKQEQSRWTRIGNELDKLNSASIIKAWIEYSKHVKPVGGSFLITRKKDGAIIDSESIAPSNVHTKGYPDRSQKVIQKDSKGVRFAELSSQKNPTGIGTSMQKSGSALMPVLVSVAPKKSSASAIIAELNLSGGLRTSEASISSVPDSVEVIMEQLHATVWCAENWFVEREAIQYTKDSIVHDNVKELPIAKTTSKLRAVEALKTWLGSKKFSKEETTNALCAALTDDLKHIILNQSETFQNLDTTSQMDFASVITVIITESMAALLISSTVDTLKRYAIDKVAEAGQEVISKWKGGGFAGGEFANSAKANSQATEDGYTGTGPITEPATPLARAWEGHRYGRQALKPAVEMLICAQKPYEGRPVDCIVETGAGALFIDGGRIGANASDANYRDSSEHKVNEDGWFGPGIKRPMETWTKGRWPPNFALCHVPPHACPACDGGGCDECNDTGLVGGCRRVGTKRVKGISGGGGPTQYGSQNRSNENTIDYPDVITYADADGLEEVAAWECAEECAVRRIGEQSGERPVSGTAKLGKPIRGPVGQYTCYGERTPSSGIGPNDAGTAARYFPQFGWAAEVAERLAAADQVFYASKASRTERDAGLEHLAEIEGHSAYGDYAGTPEHATNKDGRLRNYHPTVKNISLCHWLATLLLPPPEYAPRRILIPFSGVSSEGIGALFAGFDEIIMIEQDAEYCKIGEARMQFWSRFDSYEAAMEAAKSAQRGQRKREAEVEGGQLGLW